MKTTTAPVVEPRTRSMEPSSIYSELLDAIRPIYAYLFAIHDAGASIYGETPLYGDAGQWFMLLKDLGPVLQQSCDKVEGFIAHTPGGPLTSSRKSCTTLATCFGPQRSSCR